MEEGGGMVLLGAVTLPTYTGTNELGLLTLLKLRPTIYGHGRKPAACRVRGNAKRVG